jgi:hypothetical protein
MIIGHGLSFIDTNHRHSNGSVIRHIFKIEGYAIHFALRRFFKSLPRQKDIAPNITLLFT